MGVLSFAFTAPSYGFLDKLLKQDTKTESGNADDQFTDYNGVKHTVAVTAFDNSAGWYGRWQLGGNLSAMLESALYDSGRFTLVERGNIEEVMREQDLADSGRVAKSKSSAKMNKLKGAKYLITGDITEVEYNESGNAGGVRIKGFKVGLGGGKAHIAAIVKVIDSSTGEIIAKERVEGKAGKRSLKVGYSGASLGGELASFNKTPLGEAAQDVVLQAVKYLSSQFESVAVTGTVIKGSKEDTIINRGSIHGVQVGQKCVIETEGEDLIDPDTGEVLDTAEGEIICTIEITKVKEKLSYGKVVQGEVPAKGQIVKITP